LDGLRGLAAFAVMIFHYSQHAYPRIRQVYGFEGRHCLVQLPFIKLWFSGGFMVFLFFVISGYVLSARVVRLMVQEKRCDILKVLSSMTFRRVVRLGLPSLVASFISFIFQRLGFLGKPYDNYKPSFINDIAFYLGSLCDLFSFYDWKQYHIWYLETLWTIPVELRCSMILFLILIGIARCRRVIRLIIEGLILFNTVIYDRWDLGCFVLGLIIAEIHIYSQEFPQAEEDEDVLYSVQYDHNSPIFQSWSPGLKKLSLWAAFGLGTYLGSVPTEGTCKTPGYSKLCALTWHSEPWRYIALPGSFLIVSAILFLPVLQRPLTSSLGRYLGRVSYALYLVHESVNVLLGSSLRRLGWAVLGVEGSMYHAGFGLGLVMFVLLCLWLADMFMRAIDIPATNIAKWLEERCIVL
jgi:peptidoglycan/LPS O-acetylase OafA/YrhL